MQLTLTPTNNFVTVGGLAARRWEGVDQHGTRIIAFVAGLTTEGTHTDAERAEIFQTLRPADEDPVPYDAPVIV